MRVEGDFSRQSFLGANSERLLADLRVAIVGLGGGGSHVAQQLAHLGVGEIRLVDPDRMEGSNLNRLVGATQRDVDFATLKVDIAERTIRGVRPSTTVRKAPERWQKVATMLQDCHVLVGCVDGYLERSYLESAARRYLLPYIDIGMTVVDLGSSFAIAGQMVMTQPDGPCMRCIGFLTADRLAREENDYGAAGSNPQVVWTNGTLASLAVGQLVKLVTPWFEGSAPYSWLELDGNLQTVQVSDQPKYWPTPNRCPHHGGIDGLGDPFFSLEGSGPAKASRS